MIHDRYTVLLKYTVAVAWITDCKLCTGNWFNDNFTRSHYRSSLVQSHPDFFSRNKRAFKQRLVVCGKNGIIMMQLVQEFKPFELKGHPRKYHNSFLRYESKLWE